MLRDILVFSAVVLSECVSAQTLTVDRCIEMALESNSSIKAATYQRGQADAMVRSMKANYLPDFAATATGIYSNARGSYNIEGGNLPVFSLGADGTPSPTGGFAYFPGVGLDYKVGPMFTAGIEVTQPIYMGGKIKSGVEIALHSRDMASASLEMTRDEVIVATSKAYADVVKATRLLQVANAYKSAVIELQANVESAINHGMRHNNDRLKVAVRVNEADLNILRANNAIRLAKMNLSRLIGRSMIADFDIADDFPAVTVPAQAEAPGAIHDRPEWHALTARTEMYKSRIKLQRSELLPQIGIKAGYAYNYGFELNKEKLFNRGAFGVALNVTVPLFHFGGRSNKVEAARQQWQQSQAEMHDREQLLELDMRRAFADLEEAQAALALSEKSVEQAAENMRLSRVMFDNGMETLSDYLEAQLLWSQACQQRVEAGFNLYNSHIAYLRTIGRL